jgi:hypothetical protein
MTHPARIEDADAGDVERRGGAGIEDAAELDFGRGFAEVGPLAQDVDVLQAAADQRGDARVMLRRHQVAVGVEAELARPGVEDLAVAAQHEESVAVDRHILLVARLLQFALRKHDPGRTGRHAAADVEPHVGAVAIVVGKLAAVEQIRKHQLRTLESRCVQVGHVVADDRQVARKPEQAGQADVDGIEHWLDPFRCERRKSGPSRFRSGTGRCWSGR